MFENSKWIWGKGITGSDTYCDFRESCFCDSTKKTVIRISADSNYALHINGQFVESGQYADYPNYKIYDEINISDYITDGENILDVTVWYIGDTNFSYFPGKAGLLFEVENDGQIVCNSTETTKSRKSSRYVSGKRKMITEQLGYGFEMNMEEDSQDSDFSDSESVSGITYQLHKRENKKLLLQDRAESEIVQQGFFQYPFTEGTNGMKMQHALLSFAFPTEMDSQEGQKLYFIIDLKEETAGFLDLEIETEEACQMEIGWGEHLEDGRCRTEIEERDFSSVIHLQKGSNHVFNPLRRIGCRYLQLFIHSSKVKVHYAGLRPTIYPLDVIPYQSGNLLRDTIYDTCVHTLRTCMHEHYEDCPWREQALYTLDSRNQMLCGYYAFEEYEFAKSSLKLIAKGIREDGFLPITAPTDFDLTIPFFSLVFITQVLEYYQHSKDVDTVEFCYEAMRRIIDTYLSAVDESGLAPNFVLDNRYWNFYEWQPYMSGEYYRDAPYDVCLNAGLSIALRDYAGICDILGKDSKRYRKLAHDLNHSIRHYFYDESMQLFSICVQHDSDKFSVLGNALCVLCGATDGLHTEKIEMLLTENKDQEGEVYTIATTLPMYSFRYDALLQINRDKYKPFILKDIDQTYLYMLRKGATSFWETIKGHADFANAGSLCHGWSAIPVYYYRTLEML